MAKGKEQLFRNLPSGSWVKTPTAILSAKISSSAKIVFIAIIDNAESYHPSTRMLEQQTGLSKDAIIRALRQLVSKGYISRNLSGTRRQKISINLEAPVTQTVLELRTASKAINTRTEDLFGLETRTELSSIQGHNQKTQNETDDLIAWIEQSYPKKDSLQKGIEMMRSMKESTPGVVEGVARYINSVRDQDIRYVKRLPKLLESGAWRDAPSSLPGVETDFDFKGFDWGALGTSELI